MRKLKLNEKEADIIYTWYSRTEKDRWTTEKSKECADKILTYIAKYTRKEITKNARNTGNRVKPHR